MPIRFAGAPLRINIEGREQPSSALLGRLKFTGDSGISVSVQYDGEISEDFSSCGVFGNSAFHFSLWMCQAANSTHFQYNKKGTT